MCQVCGAFLSSRRAGSVLCWLCNEIVNSRNGRPSMDGDLEDATIWRIKRLQGVHLRLRGPLKGWGRLARQDVESAYNSAS